jgi:hypothetical protein
MKRQTALLVLAGLVGLAGTARADETTFCNTFITTLPFTITAQGHYCFDRNLSTAITAGNAITINSDFVVLDLNNFKLGGGSGGLATQAIGVFANNHRNITVRGGNIRGFRYGIRILEGTAGLSGGHLIENNVLDGNTHYAAEVVGDAVLIRNNTIANTGGETTPVDAWSYGIHSFSNLSPGGASVVRDNVVTNTFFNQTGGGDSFGIDGPEIVDHNVVVMGTITTGTSWGIEGGVCRDNTVLDVPAGQEYDCNSTVGANSP